MIVTATGWDFPTVYATTFGEAIGLVRYWRVTPPTHVAVGALLGLGRKEEAPAVQTTPDDIRAFVARAKAVGA